MKKLFLAFSVAISTFVYFFPLFVTASVKINEIAWTGTDRSANGEWIELKNNGGEVVNISGWRLEWNDGKSGVSFDTQKCANTDISANGFLLLERTSDETVLNILADCIYTGALSNSGELMILKDASNTEVDRIDGRDAWKLSGSGDTVGNNTTKETAQLTFSGWITATGTPKNENVSVFASSFTPDSNLSTTTENIPNRGQNSSGFAPVVSYDYSAHSSPFELSGLSPKIKVSLAIGRDRVVLSGSLVSFSARLTDESGNILDGGSYSWSFGDGSSLSGKDATHFYELPGEYVVVLTAVLNGREYVSRANIKVISPNFSIGIFDEEGRSFLQVANKLSSEVNLKGWQLRSGFRLFTFEGDTIILANKKISLSPKITGMDLRDKDIVDLLNPAGKVVAKGAAFLKQPRGVEVYQDSASRLENNSSSPLPVDEMRRELSLLEEKLKDLRLSLLAGISSSKNAPGLVENTKAILASTTQAKIGTSAGSKSSTSTVIVLKPDSKTSESGLWKFFRNLIYR